MKEFDSYIERLKQAPSQRTSASHKEEAGVIGEAAFKAKVSRRNHNGSKKREYFGHEESYSIVFHLNEL